MITDQSQAGPLSEADAFAHCEAIARGHYENFPVGSLLIPRVLRRHFFSIYAYSRLADDMADEGTRSTEERVAQLDAWERRLEEAFDGRADHPVFIALSATVRERNIPIEPLRNLLVAFRMDARNEGFEETRDLIEYCGYSANPVGRLVLHLFGLASAERVRLSDAVCTGLQLANFWQDIAVDLPRARLNVPRDVLRRHGYTLREMAAGVIGANFRAMMEELVIEAERRFELGRGLIRTIPIRRLRMELKLVIRGGERILEKIRAADFDVLHHRPVLTGTDKLRLALSALRG